MNNPKADVIQCGDKAITNSITINIILDCCMQSPSLIHYIIERVQPDDIYDHKQATIYKVIKYLYDKKIEVSIASVGKYLIDQKKFEDYKSTLWEIPNNWTGGGIKHYVESLLDDSARRKIDFALRETNEKLADKNYSLEQACFDIDKELKSITKNQNSEIRKLSEMATGDIYDLSENKRFFKTGIRDLDEGLHGVFGGDLIILAARPKLGKTSLAGNIACYIAQHHPDFFVLFFSLEMRARQLRRRFVSQYSQTDSFILKTNKYISEDQKDTVKHGMSKVDKLPIAITDSKNALPEIISSAKRFANANKLSCIIIDYLQLINNPIKGATRNEIVGDMSRQIKLLAGELDVPIILLSQLSRKIEMRTDPKPMLSDLRDSGMIEADADMIWFIYQDKKNALANDIYTVDVAANRDGPAGFSAELLFNKSCTTFENL